MMKVVLHLLIAVTKAKGLTVKLSKEGVEGLAIFHLQLAVVFDNFSFLVVLAVDTLEVTEYCFRRSKQIVDVPTGREVILNIDKGLTICSRTDPVNCTGGILYPVGRVFAENMIDLEAPCLVVLTIILVTEELLVRVLG